MNEINSLREKILETAARQYHTQPESLWAKFPEHVVLRHKDNQKWFALFMNVEKNKLGLAGEDGIDILNIKINPEMGSLFLGTPGYLPAYHMNKSNWITILLDGTVEMDKILSLLDLSFELTQSKKKHTSSHKRITDWIIPANPKFYDIQTAIKENPHEPFIWKQSSNIAVNDRIYLYVTAPVRAILYKCQAIEVDIPYRYEDKNLSIERAMKLKLLEQYNENILSAEKLKEHGVYAVRGPRSMPETLIRELKTDTL